MSFGLYGRRMIKSDETEVTVENVVAILNKALPYHWENRSEIQYLWYYYRGLQPILNREKQVRPEICNKIVENRANEIVSFKSGYLMGEPLQYVSRGNGDNLSDAINQLNEFVFAEEKPAKDKELADWFHICGTSFRMVLPDEDVGEDDDSPFEIYTLDPRNTFVVYNNGLGNKPLLGVKYVVDDNGIVHYSCYSDHEYFEIVESHIIKAEPHILGDIPIIEYPLNIARIGAFELVIPLLDAINLTDSNRQDGVEQFIQALMLFHNVDISSDDYEKLREEGAIKFRDIDPQLKAEVAYLTSTLNQGETQTLVDHMYQTVLTICGMPNRNGGTSTSDTGSAVIMRDGWSAAEARAKDSELMFKKSERIFLKLILNICKTLKGMDLKVCNIEIRFTRRNYENILQKAQVLDLMLKNSKIHPRLAFEHCGLFVDSDLAYTLSAEYEEEQEKQLKEAQQWLNGSKEAQEWFERTKRVIELKSKRKPSQFEVFHHLNKVRKEVTDLLLRDFGYSKRKAAQRLEKKFSGRSYEELTDVEKEIYDHFRKQQEAFDTWFIEDERKAVVDCLRSIGEHVYTANSIYPTYYEELVERRVHQDLAIGQCYRLVQELQYAIETLPVDVNTFLRFGEDIQREIDLIKGWRKSDNKFKGAISATAANFANVNNNGNANNNNASNSNGVRPDFDTSIK